MGTTAFKTLKNNAKTTINGAINGVTTSITLATGGGAAMPAAPFWATLFEDDPDINEIVLVTSKASDTMTVTRGQQSTGASAWDNGANFQVLLTAASFTDIQTALNNIETRLGDGTTSVDITTGSLGMVLNAAIQNVWDAYAASATQLTQDMRIARGNSGTPVIVNSGDAVRQRFWGHDGGAWRQFAEIEAFINGTPGSGDMPGGIRFKVSPDGGATPVTALTLSQNLLAAFAGAVSMASTLTVTGAASMSSTLGVGGDLTIGSGPATRSFVVVASGGYSATARFGGTGTAQRWAVGKNNTAESGSNAGSDFAFIAYDDGGVLIDTAFSITRAQFGPMTVARPLVMSSTQRNTPFTITYAASITPNARNGSYQRCTLTGNVTVNAPSNLTAGDILDIEFIQDGTGSRTATWNAAYVFASGDTGTLTTTANRQDYFRFRATTSGRLICIAQKKNFT
jgi:hypothetical protein